MKWDVVLRDTLDEGDLYFTLNPDTAQAVGHFTKKFDSQVSNTSNGHFWLFNVLIDSL